MDATVKTLISNSISYRVFIFSQNNFWISWIPGCLGDFYLILVLTEAHISRPRNSLWTRRTRWSSDTSSSSLRRVDTGRASGAFQACWPRQTLRAVKAHGSHWPLRTWWALFAVNTWRSNWSLSPIITPGPWSTHWARGTNPWWSSGPLYSSIAFSALRTRLSWRSGWSRGTGRSGWPGFRGLFYSGVILLKEITTPMFWSCCYFSFDQFVKI